MTERLDATERAVQALARSLYERAAQHKPSLFEAKDLLGRMIDWSLNDDSLRVALFRFVDVLPSLESSSEIGRHLQEYFARVDHALGGLVVIAHALHAGTLVAPVVRRFPLVPGIDFAGTVLTSSHADFSAGDKVVLNGWGVGETHHGAFAGRARVKGDWLVPLPEGLMPRDAMADPRRRPSPFWRASRNSLPRPVRRTRPPTRRPR